MEYVIKNIPKDCAEVPNQGNRIVLICEFRELEF